MARGSSSRREVGPLGVVTFLQVTVTRRTGHDEPVTAPRFFNAVYVEHATLKDGSRVVLRLLRPEDKEALRAGFEHLSPESRYARFFASKLTLNDEELHYLTDIDQESHFAIAAAFENANGQPGQGLGVARFIRLDDAENTAEAAVAITDEVHGRGLGKLLFMRLCAAATERGVERFRCEVLGSNASMKHLIDHVTPERKVEVGSGVISIVFAIPKISPTAPITEAPPPNGMYRLFRAAAQNTVEWTEAVRRLWGRNGPRS